MERRARIVATIGPASASRAVLARLLSAGADVLRLNLSHGSHDDHRRVIRLAREVAAELGRCSPLLLDLMGPRYRLGEIAGGSRLLRRGERLRLGAPGPGVELPVDDTEILRHLRRGERVLVDNGLVELRVERREGGSITVRVLFGGPVGTRKGINLPDTDLPFAISAKDREDIRFAVAEDADYLAASYVGRGRELAELRRVAAEAGGALPIVAKLERARAVEHLDEIVEAADAVMVARGDLGVEVPLHRVPVLQKEIVAAGRRLGKPVIVATQMLESMMERPRPTRAEVSDVANAVFDGADALMLSGETAAGRFPVEAVRTMDRIIREAERYRWSRASRQGWTPPPGTAAERLRPGQTEGHSGVPEVDFELPEIVCGAAVQAAERLAERSSAGGPRHGAPPHRAAGKVSGGLRDRVPIVAFSQGGFTARMIARYRPEAPVLVFVNDPRLARRLQLVWGVRALLLEREVRAVSEVVRVVERQLLAAKLVRPGQAIVILMGDPIAERPLTNLMRVHRIGGGSG